MKAVHVQDAQEQPAAPSPWDSAGACGHRRLLYTFVVPILRLGAKRPLQLTDLPPVPVRDRAPHRVQRIQRAWASELARAATPHHRRRRPSLLRALLAAHTCDFVLAGMLAALEVAAIVGQPLMLRPFVAWLGDSAAALGEGLGLAFGLSVLTVLQALIHHANFYQSMRMGWNLRIGMTGVLHAHLLRVSTAALRGSGSAGHGAADCSPPPDIAALVSSDCQRFDNALPFLHFGWLAFVALGVVSFLLARIVGAVPMAAGIGVLLITVALQGYFSMRFASVRTQIAKRTDARAKASAEVFNAMLSVKAYGWERAMHARARACALALALDPPPFALRPPPSALRPPSSTLALRPPPSPSTLALRPRPGGRGRCRRASPRCDARRPFTC